MEAPFHFLHGATPVQHFPEAVHPYARLNCTLVLSAFAARRLLSLQGTAWPTFGPPCAPSASR